MKAYNLKIHGRVQGVWFRKSTDDEARKIGVNGWVKNAPDGTVEAHVWGENEKVDLLIGWCHKGPVFAKVTKVDIVETVSENIKGFRIVR